MKRMLILVLYWAWWLLGFAAAFALKEGCVLVGIILLLAFLGVHTFRQWLKRAWSVPSSALEILWEKQDRKRNVENDKNISSEQKDRLKQSIDDEKCPIDWLSTLLCDSIITLLLILFLYNKFFA